MDMAGYFVPAICFPYFGQPPVSSGNPVLHAMPVIGAIDFMSGLVAKAVSDFEPLF
jgi:hypothetical protein